MKQAIQTAQAPAAIGCYSQAIQAGNTVYLSGQIPLDPQGDGSISSNIEDQIKRVFTNLSAVAKAAGGSLDHIVKLTVFLMDIAHSAQVNTIMQDFFTKPYPARSSIQVAGLPRGAGVEVEAIMVLSNQ